MFFVVVIISFSEFVGCIDTKNNRAIKKRGEKRWKRKGSDFWGQNSTKKIVEFVLHKEEVDPGSSTMHAGYLTMALTASLFFSGVVKQAHAPHVGSAGREAAEHFAAARARRRAVGVHV